MGAPRSTPPLPVLPWPGQGTEGRICGVRSYPSAETYPAARTHPPGGKTSGGVLALTLSRRDTPGEGCPPTPTGRYAMQTTPNRQRTERTKPMAWDSKKRKAQLPANWSALRRKVLDRDQHRCCATLPNGSRCSETAKHVDHVVRGDDHSMSNLQALCPKHHFQKSAAEGRAAQGPRPRQQRTSEPHPGLKW